MAHVVEVDRTQSVLARWEDPVAALTAQNGCEPANSAAADADDFVAAHLLIRECVATSEASPPHRS